MYKIISSCQESHIELSRVRGVYNFMKKTSLKTFVCSFVFSLFMIFTINGLYFRANPSKSDEIKISNKNITLFFKNEPKQVAAAEIIPVKKIALTLPQKEISGLTENDLIPLTFEENYSEIKIASVEEIASTPQEAPKLEAKEIPLEIQGDVQLKPKSDKPLIEDFDKIINGPPPVDETEMIIHKNPSDEILISDNPKKTISQPQELILAHTEDNAFSVAKAKNKFEINNIDTSQQEELKKDIAKTTVTEDNLLIPILKDNVNTKLAGEIQVVKSPDKNQIAMRGKNIPIKSMESSMADTKEEKSNSSNDGWETMAKKNNDENPWLVAKGTKHPRNSNVLNQEYYKQDDAEIKSVLANNSTSKTGNGVKVADAGMVKNILIPIPEAILNEEKITPQLVSSQDDKGTEKEITQKEEEQQQSSGVVKKAEDTSITATPTPTSENKSLLKSITSIFSTGSSVKDKKTTQDENKTSESSEESFFNTISGRIKKQDSSSKILPTEIRLSFQPNRAEISGQTLKWIQAFANKTLEDATIGIEIRIDGTNSYALQQKRLNLLHNILTNKGVEYSKINTVFTTREPNSFIIRTIRINSNFNGSIEKNDNKEPTYHQQW